MRADTDGKQKNIDDSPEEVLKPGALYRDCSVVRINVRKPDIHTEEKQEDDGVADDGEYGGEKLGRSVWENFEASLKHREKNVVSDKPTTSSENKEQ